ncbi:MAG: nucleotidyltransferase domain-containing protein, partial [Mariprofundaceae bacterium]|nr:nucleotidyltransferase domain-containing protein [Mariprofundaceae bacterium]
MPIKIQLDALQKNIENAFTQQNSGAKLVQQMTKGVDSLIVQAWQALAPNAALRADLVAVGGYGRGDLAPRSDWDLSILLPKGSHADLEDEIALFLRSLWDAGGKVAASTRNINQTIESMQEDVNTATAALESRLLAGNGNEFKQYEKKIRRYFRRRRKSFVEEKLEEMHTRHKKNGNTAFLMEPDIKENRGGLRDIHSVFWIARAWYDEQSIAGLQQRGAISKRECAHLLTAQDFLWRCRTFMHLQSRRGSDRLSFEMQAMLAEAMGYDQTGGRPMVELFMKDFFRHSGRIARVSSLLMMHFQEQLQPKVFSMVWPLDNGFSLHAQRVSIQHKNVFQERPLRLLEIFHVAQQDKRHLSSTALRQVRADVMLINDDFRANPEAKNIFLAILRDPRNVATALREMNDTGVLGRFVPLFRHTVGLGQFNRYHAYTVDEHTLRAIAEARLFFH